MQISPADVQHGYTVPTVDDTKILSRPTVIIHSGDKPPHDRFSTAQYRWYGSDNTDFDGKLAFSVLQTLLTLAETTTQSNTVVTNPGPLNPARPSMGPHPTPRSHR